MSTESTNKDDWTTARGCSLPEGAALCGVVHTLAKRNSRDYKYRAKYRGVSDNAARQTVHAKRS